MGTEVASVSLIDRAKTWAGALRVHHWSKNVLMFVPLLLAHQWWDQAAVGRTLTGFILLLIVTSASYLINDIRDLAADRQHPVKRLRAVASGAIPVRLAATVAGLALPLALALALLVDGSFAATLAAYLAMTLAYSFGLKRIPLLDALVIAALFTSRMVMGTAVLDAPLPIWLAIFSMFLFFSLALAKRQAELLRPDSQASIAWRGYRAADAPLVLAIGIASAAGSVIIFALYLIEEVFRKVPYARPELLWVAAFCVAIVVGRIWLLTNRGEMNDDPVSFALRDRACLLAGLALLLAFAAAL